ncbi:hypothetical protein [uncultured Duncaniella sp.]|uniref:hypothetical protein n=1 Tax=uncultured Duncaniella sp. TaxID=2768039 RepID=UPI0026771188|nr:hypothetical protein [uncultured Duncaniella sp.]
MEIKFSNDLQSADQFTLMGIVIHIAEAVSAPARAVMKYDKVLKRTDNNFCFIGTWMMSVKEIL